MTEDEREFTAGCAEFGRRLGDEMGFLLNRLAFLEEKVRELEKAAGVYDDQDWVSMA